MMVQAFFGSLMLAVVLSSQKTPFPPMESPLFGPERASSLTQRHNEAPDCAGLIEEVGDRDKLPPWAMGLLVEGSFFSLFRFNTRSQAESCAATREDFVIRLWDRKSRSWKKP